MLSARAACRAVRARRKVGGVGGARFPMLGEAGRDRRALLAKRTVSPLEQRVCSMVLEPEMLLVAAHGSRQRADGCSTMHGEREVRASCSVSSPGPCDGRAGLEF